MMRYHLVLALGATMTLSSPAMSQVQASPAPVVRTDLGKVQGEVADGIASWKGIPFAAPPVGALRWRMPQPAARWQGVRRTTAYANDCMQRPFGGDAAPLGTTPAEDCLYLNVWKPAGAKARLPVIFWIFGGGFANGGASPPTYSGANLARQGVMFVSANYRVGRFGFFAHPALTKAGEDRGLLQNYGYMDQIAALRWVKRNIAAFGGDPNNITIVGESAGGRSVHNLMTSPLSRGMFSRAVVMSGGGVSGSRDKLADVEARGVAFAEGKGISAGDPAALAKLRALSGDQVVDGLNLINRSPTFTGPTVDGRIAVDPLQAYRSGRFNRVPLMIGATSNDTGGPTGPHQVGARNAAGIFSSQGVPAYEYRFSYVAESLGANGGARHASDIPFFFDTQQIKYGDKTTPRDMAAGRLVSAYLVNFAKTGNPAGPGLPPWPRYDRAGDVIMNFREDATAAAGRDPLGEKLDAQSAETPR